MNNKSNRETFMKMLQVQAGLGMGVKKFRVVFVFDNERALDSFVNSGWQLGLLLRDRQNLRAFPNCRKNGVGVEAAVFLAAKTGLISHQVYSPRQPPVSRGVARSHSVEF